MLHDITLETSIAIKKEAKSKFKLSKRLHGAKVGRLTSSAKKDAVGAVLSIHKAQLEWREAQLVHKIGSVEVADLKAEAKGARSEVFGARERALATPSARRSHI